MAKGELPKMKYVQNAGRNFSVIPKVYSRARMAFCRSMSFYADDSVFCDDCVAESD